MDIKITTKYNPTCDKPERIKKLTDYYIASDKTQL